MELTKLFEQIIRGNRVYWHGSPKKFDKLETAPNWRTEEKEPVVFLTTKREYQMGAGRKEGTGYIYQVMITKPVNIFNVSSTTDYKKVKQLASNDEKVLETLEKLRNIFLNPKENPNPKENSRHWYDVEKIISPFIYKTQLYDGCSETEDQSENLFLFNANSLKIIDRKPVEYWINKDENMTPLQLHKQSEGIKNAYWLKKVLFGNNIDESKLVAPSEFEEEDLETLVEELDQFKEGLGNYIMENIEIRDDDFQNFIVEFVKENNLNKEDTQGIVDILKETGWLEDE